VNIVTGAPVTSDPDLVEGSIGTLRREFGLWFVVPAGERSKVNTVQEEQVQTNYRIVCDYLTSLRQSWTNDRKFFLRSAAAAGTQPFFGTQLVLLTRQLTVIAESVGEVRFAMDSVSIGSSERQSLELVFTVNGQQSPMFIEELLLWVHNFATEEAPKLITDGGKHAVQNGVAPILRTLDLCVQQVITEITPPNANPDLPVGITTGRVRRAWRELEQQLATARVMADPIEHAIPAQA